ncbi:hypothetical protein ILUMI_15397 [Ignelater luminosus]|uniref:Uncharacterized protein n=1 Tax=Ignelater luminosus TaxID=2038154 RepID=A0A8K0G9J7_IGNLU|nr:hypothetical protein ILUMI_15397 [Ignelater luminosus]
MEANSIPAAKVIPILLVVIGKETFKILRNICVPVLPKEKTYSQLCELSTQYFIKPKATFEELIELYNATQTTNESVNEWYVRIKSLASNCNLGVNLNIILQDKFVCGLLCGPIQDRVCGEDKCETLLELLQIALKKEAASIRVTAVNRVTETKVSLVGQIETWGSPGKRSI